MHQGVLPKLVPPKMGTAMPISILVAAVLYALAAFCAGVQLVSLWAFVAHGTRHPGPWAGYLGLLPMAGLDLGLALAAVAAALTLLTGRWAWLTALAGVVAALIFPVGTLAMVVTLTVARRHFGWWYQRRHR